MRREQVEIKSRSEILLMREAGLVVWRTLEALRAAAAPGVTTLELDDLAEQTIRGAGAVPSFKGYPGNSTVPFPGVICASVNEEVVHGIPSRKRPLQDGDLLSIDCGAILDGWHGDSAITVPIGAVAPDELALSEACERSLWAGLAAVQLGGRLTDISHAVESSVLADEKRLGLEFGIVEHYGGHGIGTQMHQAPHLLNYGRPGRGQKLVKGLALAVEPMLTLGTPDTRELDDHWTVVTTDATWAAHWEHTVAVTEEGPWVLTAEDGGAARLAELGVRAGVPAATAG
ncbi:MAG TPA: type I methionyl aminopeptidase [Frankiaceae bacterium]|nr:type I methionyl aminopeptidase [Frankiaceae bacterium]